jgi:hypothetical protein
MNDGGMNEFAVTMLYACCPCNPCMSCFGHKLIQIRLKLQFRRLYRLHQLGVALASLHPQSGLDAVARASTYLTLVDDVVEGLAVYFRLVGLHRVKNMERRWNISAVIASWLVVVVVFFGCFLGCPRT